jgi:hypothetical protein
MMKYGPFFDELCAQVLHKDIHPESPMFPLHEHVKNTLRAQIKEGPTCSRKDGDKYDVAYADCADSDFNITYLGSPQLRQLIRTSKPFLELLVRIARHRVKSTLSTEPRRNKAYFLHSWPGNASKWRTWRTHLVPQKERVARTPKPRRALPKPGSS